MVKVNVILVMFVVIFGFFDGKLNIFLYEGLGGRYLKIFIRFFFLMFYLNVILCNVGFFNGSVKFLFWYDICFVNLYFLFDFYFIFFIFIEVLFLLVG